MDKKDVLIFGISGGLGTEIAKELIIRDMSFVGTFRNANMEWRKKIPVPPKKASNTTFCYLNLSERMDKIERSELDKFEFKYAISTVALSDVDGCYWNPIKSFRNNVMVNLHIYLYCAKRGIPLYYVSTNDVFGNDIDTVVPWKTSDTPSPQGVYARHKETTEGTLLDMSGIYNKSPVTIIRMSLISFYRSGGGSTFIKNILNSMRMGETVYAMIDQYVNPTHVGTVAQKIIDYAQANHGNIIHIAPINWMTRYDFVKYIRDNSPIEVHPKFDIIPCTLQDLHKKKIMVDARPQKAVLAPHPLTEFTLEEEIDKALSTYQNTLRDAP